MTWGTPLHETSTDPGDPWWAEPEQATQTAHLVREGLVRRLVLQVHVDVDVPDCASVRARGVDLALARCGHHVGTAVVGYRSAAWVHGGGPALDQVDVVIAPRATRHRSPLLAMHEHKLGRRDVQQVAGLSVTTPVRTAADLARALTAAQSVPLLDLLSRHTGLRAVDVLAQLEAMPYGRGVAKARDAVNAWAAAVASR